MWIVKATHGRNRRQITRYGPLASQAEADAFATFVTEEADPAATEYRPPYAAANHRLISPVQALLDWRDRVRLTNERAELISALDELESVGAITKAGGRRLRQVLAGGDA